MNLKALLILVCTSASMHYCAGQRLDLSGRWRFSTDSTDIGITQKWYKHSLPGTILLPGSMTTNGLGDDIRLNTPWTGSIVDSSWFFKPEYAAYRKPGHIKVPFWLQPLKYYKGPAWYQRTIHIPAAWKSKHITLFIERSHWETTIWVDDHRAGMEDALGAPDVFDLTTLLTPGEHTLTVRIDNRGLTINPGENSHSITDHTGTNWNGMIGDIHLSAQPSVYLSNLRVYPDADKKKVHVHIVLRNMSGQKDKQRVDLDIRSAGSPAPSLYSISRQVSVAGDSAEIDEDCPLGDHILRWDEFHPNLYSITVALSSGDKQTINFGVRHFSANGNQLTINGHPVFLRGTLNCADFPLTGYPPTDLHAWLALFRKCKAYGLNHMRFHSWCPPEAAFKAADLAGFYLQIECSSWANQDTQIGNGGRLDTYIYQESSRIVQAYGNHPSFCMMAYGNEPSGKHLTAYLTDFVRYWKARDNRRLYTTAAGWPIIPDNDYNSTPEPRIQHWGEGLESIINAHPPRTNYDWHSIISKWPQPTVSHEIGQWCVYPDFKEMTQYTGILKPKNFEIFRDRLAANGLRSLAHSFLMASGKLQVLCYKADIEAALRTPGFGGFQLLGLNDFSGQGTALVGVLNVFWRDKGYITSTGFRKFCDTTVPLVRFPKMIWLNNEVLEAPAEVAHFGTGPLTQAHSSWRIEDETGKVLYRGALSTKSIPVGNGTNLGMIRQPLQSIARPSRLTLTLSVAGKDNSWVIFVYPSSLPPAVKEIVVTQSTDTALAALGKGAKVLLTLKKGSLRPDLGGNIAVGFSSIFWNTAWTHSQPPTTLGILCDPKSPALRAFPTEYYSEWEWWDAMSHSNAILLDSLSRGLKPIVRVIDDWVTARSLGLLFECRVGKGRLLVSGIDLLTDAAQRPEAKQLLYSLEQYMASPDFHPAQNIRPSKLLALSHL